MKTLTSDLISPRIRLNAGRMHYCYKVIYSVTPLTYFILVKFLTHLEPRICCAFALSDSCREFYKHLYCLQLGLDFVCNVTPPPPPTSRIAWTVSFGSTPLQARKIPNRVGKIWPSHLQIQDQPTAYKCRANYHTSGINDHRSSVKK